MSIVMTFKSLPKSACAVLSVVVMTVTSQTASAQISETQIAYDASVNHQVSETNPNIAMDGVSDETLTAWAEPLPNAEIPTQPKTQAVPGYEGCEIVLIETVAKGASLASYRPADDFLESIYDDEDGFQETVDSLKVRAVMCTRDRVIPQLRDFPILSSGVQFSISNDFDSHDSQFMTVFYKAGKFQHKFSGPTLSDGELIALRDVMEVYNLQEHDLDASKTK